MNIIPGDGSGLGKGYENEGQTRAFHVGGGYGDGDGYMHGDGKGDGRSGGGGDLNGDGEFSQHDYLTNQWNVPACVQLCHNTTDLISVLISQQSVFVEAT